MDKEGKRWMTCPRSSDEYINGLEKFLDLAFTQIAQGEEIACPCKNCCHRYWHRRNIVYEHLICDGFIPGYVEWVFHGEGSTSSFNMNITSDNDVDDSALHMQDDIDGLLYDNFREVVEEFQNHGEQIGEGPNTEAKKFYKLVEEGQQELYPGCKSFSRLSFTIRLYLFKCLHGLSNVAFADLLELLKEAFPNAQIPESFNKARNVVKDLGLDYKKIHACPNDCILFWKDDEEANQCRVCGASRWKCGENQILAKVLRHFPLKPRLQRLFMCSETAKSMKWHMDERPKDGYIRHPADGQAWKDFDLSIQIFLKSFAM